MKHKNTVVDAVRIRSTTMIPFNPMGKLRQTEKPKLFTTFDGLGDKKEHLAITFGEPSIVDPVLVRLHSECLTGDIFGSFLCDCRAQLHESIETLEGVGGVLLYLRQEGRGIGLYNKLEAYALQQTEGLATFIANQRIGFPQDAREYDVAAGMLKAMGISRIILLSNNPDKAAQLTKYGIDVVQRISTKTHVNHLNKKYLSAKYLSGHQLVGLAENT